MQALSRRVTRLSVAAAGAASIVLTIGGIGMAAGGGSADGSPNGSLAATPPPAAVAAAMAPGSELQFIAVAPCRIIDTRVKGGALVNAKRTFAAVAPYTAQGGNAAGCDIPPGIAAVQINLGALSYSGGVGWVKGWATGTTEPLASLVNYDKTGPVANMVTLPVNASGHFDLRTKARAHLYVDIAGYYVKPLYAAVSSGGAVYASISSGVTSVTRISAGLYDVQFDRDVQRCSATTASITWSSSLDVSPDVGAGADANTVRVGIVDPAGTFTDGYFTLSLTC